MDQLGCREQGLPSLPVPAGAHPAAGAGHQGHVPGTVKGAAPDIAAIPDPPSCRYPAVHPFRTSDARWFRGLNSESLKDIGAIIAGAGPDLPR